MKAPRLPRLPWKHVVFVALFAVAAAIAAAALRPNADAQVPAITLDSVIPSRFGQWNEIKSPLVQMGLTPQGAREAAVAATYDASLMRSYSDGNGPPVMVAFAYGRSQRQEGKIHRPELCYSSQGFTVDGLVDSTLSTQLVPSGAINIKRLVAKSRGRLELVSYWIRIGDLFSQSAVKSRLYILGAGLQGHIPDGILFRVSQIVSPDATPDVVEAAYRRQEAMMLEMSASLPQSTRWVLVGAAAQ